MDRRSHRHGHPTMSGFDNILAPRGPYSGSPGLSLIYYNFNFRKNLGESDCLAKVVRGAFGELGFSSPCRAKHTSGSILAFSGMHEFLAQVRPYALPSFLTKLM